MEEIIKICKHVIECMVNDNYELLEIEGALETLSERHNKRVLHEYNPDENIIIPPEEYYKKIYVNKYNDGSGYHVDVDLWYYSGRSDLTLQLDLRQKEENELEVIIDDLRVL